MRASRRGGSRALQQNRGGKGALWYCGNVGATVVVLLVVLLSDYVCRVVAKQRGGTQQGGRNTKEARRR